MNYHEHVLSRFESAYDLHKRTGLPYGKAKRWWRQKRLVHPGWWQTVLKAANLDSPIAFINLAMEYNR